MKSYNPLYVDAVVSNPPYSQKWDSDHKETDPRYARFGLAPKTKADYAFLLHDLYHIKPDGATLAIVILFLTIAPGLILRYNNKRLSPQQGVAAPPLETPSIPQYTAGAVSPEAHVPPFQGWPGAKYGEDYEYYYDPEMMAAYYQGDEEGDEEEEEED